MAHHGDCHSDCCAIRRFVSRRQTSHKAGIDVDTGDIRESRRPDLRKERVESIDALEHEVWKVGTGPWSPVVFDVERWPRPGYYIEDVRFNIAGKEPSVIDVFLLKQEEYAKYDVATLSDNVKGCGRPIEFSEPHGGHVAVAKCHDAPEVGALRPWPSQAEEFKNADLTVDLMFAFTIFNKCDWHESENLDMWSRIMMFLGWTVDCRVRVEWKWENGIPKPYPERRLCPKRQVFQHPFRWW